VTQEDDRAAIAAEEGETSEEQESAEEEALEEEEAQTEPEPEPQPELSAEAAMARDKAAEREHKRHENALAKIHGEQEWQLYSLCPLCVGDGYLTPWPQGEMVPEQFEAITAFAGRTEPVEYKESSFHQRCEECDGRGHTISGAQPPLDPLKLCDACNGNGYTQKTPQLPTPAPVTIPATANGQGVPIIPSYGSPGPADEWGRPSGHAHYGIPPAAVIG
jgi:rubrerythrin